MAAAFQAIVIGAGPAGEVCAAKLAERGLRTACVERELVAGECSYWGCMPSKVLLRPLEALAAARRAPGAAAAATGEVDSAAVFAWRDAVVDNYDDTEHAAWLDHKNVELLRGEAKIAGRGRVEVAGETYEADHIVIATGSDAAMPPIDGLDELEGLWTNREVTAVSELPERLLVLGGGPIGAEMAQALARMGVSVCLVEAEDRLLPGAPRRAGEALARALEEDGVELRLGAAAKRAERHGDRFKLIFEGTDNVEGDKLLVATGRSPRVEGLGLETVGIEPGERGEIEVDERLRAAEGVWAAGDVTGVAMLTHVGKYQARLAARDIGGEKVRADYRAIPSIAFTDPQVATVGDTGDDGGQSTTVEISKTARNVTYHRPSDRPGFLTLYSDGEKLTGACAVGPEAGEWLGQATVAIRAELPLALLRDTIQPFPSFSELFQTALDQL